MTESGDATCKFLDVAEALGLGESHDSVDLNGVCFDSPFRNDVAKQLACRHPERTLIRVHLDLVPPQVCEGFSEIGQEIVLPIRLDDIVVDVDVDIAADLTRQALLHATLVRGTSVLEAERHWCVEICTEQRDESRFSSSASAILIRL